MGRINKKDITPGKDLKVGNEKGKILRLSFVSLVNPGACIHEFKFYKEHLLKIIKQKKFFLTPNSINSVHTYADTFNFDWPSVHTYPVNTVDDYAIFLKTCLGVNFLKVRIEYGVVWTVENVYS